MENIIKIKAESRTEVGKQVAKRIRKMNRIPAIIYGEKKETIPITLELDEIKKILKSEMGENTILKIHRDDVEVDAMLKEIQYDYLSDRIIHADFIRLDLTKKIHVNVPIILKGEPVGVKLEDGIFDFVNREIELKCLPSKIPSRIELDVSGLKVGSSLKFGIIELDDEVELLSNPNTVICAVSARGAAEEEAAEEEAEEIEGGQEEGPSESSGEEETTEQ